MTTAVDDIVGRVAQILCRKDAERGFPPWGTLTDNELKYYREQAGAVVDEIESLRAAGPGREETIEECAKVADEYLAFMEKWKCSYGSVAVAAGGGIPEQIRALASQPAKPVPVEAVEAARTYGEGCWGLDELEVMIRHGRIAAPRLIGDLIAHIRALLAMAGKE